MLLCMWWKLFLDNVLYSLILTCKSGRLPDVLYDTRMYKGVGVRVCALLT